MCNIDVCEEPCRANGMCRKHYDRQYRLEHREYTAERKKRWREQNKEHEFLRTQKYRQEHPERVAETNKAWKQENKKRLATYYRYKLKNDLNFRLADRLRGRLRSAIRNKQKVGSAIRDLGCSNEDFIIYLEDKFEEGMTWENWSQTGWHIDHIRPLSSFDLEDRDQFLAAAHYTNMQPMWAHDNLSKGKQYGPTRRGSGLRAGHVEEPRDIHTNACCGAVTMPGREGSSV